MACRWHVVPCTASSEARSVDHYNNTMVLCKQVAQSPKMRVCWPGTAEPSDAQGSFQTSLPQLALSLEGPAQWPATGLSNADTSPASRRLGHNVA